MHRLQTLIEQSTLEFETAEDYIHCAHKTDNGIRNEYRELAKDELEHIEKLVHIGDETKFEKDGKEETIWTFERARILEKRSKLLAQLTQIK